RQCRAAAAMAWRCADLWIGRAGHSAGAALSGFTHARPALEIYVQRLPDHRPMKPLMGWSEMILARLTSSSRPERSGVEGPCLNDWPQVVERRSLRYASLRSASVGTTDRA